MDTATVKTGQRVFVEYLVTLWLSSFVIVLIFKKKRTKFESVNVKIARAESKKKWPAQNTKSLIRHYALDFQKKLIPGCWHQDL